MKKILLTTALVATLGACAQGKSEWLCNEAAIAWDKVGEPTEYDEYCTEYFVPYEIIPVEHDDDGPRVTNTPTPPSDGPEDDTPDGDTDTDTDTPDDTSDTGGGDDSTGDDTVGRGNPGNDKDVGRSGEKVDKGMDESDGSGSRGNSTRRNDD